MANGDQNQQPPRYWFPYWSGAPQSPPPASSRPPVRPQPSHRLSPPAAPSSPSQHRQPTAPATRGAAPPTPPHAAQSQASSRPSPSRAPPLAPIRDRDPAPSPNTNSNAADASAAPTKPPPKPVALPATPKPKDVDVVPQPEKTVIQHGHGHGKSAGDKEHKVADKEKKDEHKSKEKDKEKKHHAGEDSKHKEKEKDKEKEKEKEKEKHHHAHSGEESKHREVKVEHGKLHGEIKAGVANMVHKATGAATSGHGHGQGHPAASVITLAGENKGASMKVGGGGKSKDGWKELHGGHRLDGGAVDGGQKKQGMMTALINSNVQVINNSLLLQSTCSGGDPGVHLKLSAKSTTKDKQKHSIGDKAAAKK